MRTTVRSPMPDPESPGADRSTFGLAAIAARDAAAVSRFVDRVAGLPLDEWLIIGARVSDGGCVADRRTAAAAIIDAIISDRGLDVVAWSVRDLVETAAWSALDQRGTRRNATVRLHLAAARRAAERAALALALRGYLPAADFAALCAPFAHCAPLGVDRSLDAAA